MKKLFLASLAVLASIPQVQASVCTQAAYNYYAAAVQNAASGVGPKAGSSIQGTATGACATSPLDPSCMQTLASTFKRLCQGQGTSVAPAQCMYSALSYNPAVTNLGRATDLCTGANSPSEALRRYNCSMTAVRPYYSYWDWAVYDSYNPWLYAYPVETIVVSGSLGGTSGYVSGTSSGIVFSGTTTGTVGGTVTTGTTTTGTTTTGTTTTGTTTTGTTTTGTAGTTTSGTATSGTTPGGYSGTTSGGYSGTTSGGYSGTTSGGYSGTTSGGFRRKERFVAVRSKRFLKPQAFQNQTFANGTAQTRSAKDFNYNTIVTSCATPVPAAGPPIGGYVSYGAASGRSDFISDFIRWIIK